MNKFDKLESDSNQKMKDYEKKIYDLEKNHIREQDRLKVGKIHLLKNSHTDCCLLLLKPNATDMEQNKEINLFYLCLSRKR